MTVRRFRAGMTVEHPDHAHDSLPAVRELRRTNGDLSSATAASSQVQLTKLQRFALWTPAWQFNAVAGAMGGITSGIVTCPLDVIKTKLQAQGGFTRTGDSTHSGRTKVYNGLVGTSRVIFREEGFRGMYRGLGPIMMGYLPTWAVYFTVYQRSKMLFSQLSDNRHIVNIHSSIVAGASSTLVTNPIWVVKTRMMSQSVFQDMSHTHSGGSSPSSSGRNSRAPWHYRSTLDAVRKMYRSEGLLSFYSGLTPALMGLSHVAVHVPMYEFLKTKFTGQGLGAQPESGQRSGQSQWPGILAASIISKILASSATYPHEVIRTRLQTQMRRPAKQGCQRTSPVPERKYRGVVQTFRRILHEEGWRAFYAGMGTNMMRAVPAATVTFLTYEGVMSMLLQARREGEARLGIGEGGVG